MERMDDLAAFCAARLDEDEGRAKGWAEPGGAHWPWLETRVLREVAAGRAILAEYGRIAESARRYPNAANAAALIAMQTAVRHLVAVYSDHPDYRQEWKP